MSTQTVFTSDIVTPKSLINYLDGTAMFCVSSPFFAPPGMAATDKKKWLSIRENKDKSAKFTMLVSPEIYLRTINGSYTKNFTIGLVPVQRTSTGIVRTPKDYFVSQPYGEGYKPADTKTSKQKLSISPVNIDEGDIILNRFNWQLTMLMDFLLIAKVANIDLHKFEGMPNEQLFAEFANAVNSSMQLTSKFTIDPNYILTFDNPPCLTKDPATGATILVSGLEDPYNELCKMMMTSFKVAIGPRVQVLGNYKQALQLPNVVSLPQICSRVYMKQNATDDQPYGKSFNYKIIVNYRNKESKVPDFLITLEQRPGQTMPYTHETIPRLWGGMREDGKPGRARQRGAIFCVPQMDYRYLQMGNPGVSWRAQKMCLSKAPTEQQIKIDEGDEWMTGMIGEDMDEEPIPQPQAPPQIVPNVSNNEQDLNFTTTEDYAPPSSI